MSNQVTAKGSQVSFQLSVITFPVVARRTEEATASLHYKDVLTGFIYSRRLGLIK